MIVLLFLFVSFIFPAGLTSPTASIYLSNLKIGQSYSLQKLAGFKFKVSYRGKKTARVKIHLSKPKKNRGQYYPIPNLDWIKLERNDFRLEPGETASTDIIVSIPDDENHLGKNYYVELIPEALPIWGGGGIAMSVALLCRFNFSIAPKPPTKEERMLATEGLAERLKVLISPEIFFLHDLDVGKKVSLEKRFKKSLKIINSTDQKIKVHIQLVNPSKYGFKPPKNYQVITSNEILFTRKKTIFVKPDKIKKIKVFFNFPQKEAGKKFYSLLRLEIFSPRLHLHRFVKFYISTKSQN